MSEFPADISYDKGYVLLDLNNAATLSEPTVTLRGQTWYRKQELHCSLVAVSRLAPLVAEARHISEAAAALVLVDAAQVALRFQPVTPAAILAGDNFRFVKKDDKQSIVLQSPGQLLAPLFAALARSVETELPVQPAHVTLYTIPEGQGIGIPSYEVLAEMAEPASAEETARLRDVLTVKRGATT